MKVCVVGLGYVGLNLGVELSKHFDVVGYDINKQRVEELKKGYDKNGELEKEVLAKSNIQYTYNIEDAKGCKVYIIAVPTPVTKAKQPDLKYIISAAKDVAKVIQKGCVVVLESTVFPGTSEEVVGGTIEKERGIKLGSDFYVAYSSERVNPGDKNHTFKNTTKVVAVQKGAEIVIEMYKKICDDVYIAPSLKVAEMSKLVENAQRDINIAFINEITLICSKLGIDVHEVLKAASTKWNFIRLSPGLVGGHCIPVDPYYLIHKSREANHEPLLTNSARTVHELFYNFVKSKVLEKIQKHVCVRDARVLFIGVTYKENVPDLRNSQNQRLAEELKAFVKKLDVYDPVLGIDQREGDYDVAVVAVPHKKVMEEFSSIKNKKKKAVIDIKNAGLGTPLF